MAWGCSDKRRFCCSLSTSGRNDVCLRLEGGGDEHFFRCLPFTVTPGQAVSARDSSDFGSSPSSELHESLSTGVEGRHPPVRLRIARSSTRRHPLKFPTFTLEVRDFLLLPSPRCDAPESGPRAPPLPWRRRSSRGTKLLRLTVS